MIVTFLPLILTYFMFAIPAFFVVALIAYLVRHLSLASRNGFMVLASTLVLTPALAPATLSLVPAPFGLLLVSTAIDGDWRDLASLITGNLLWHAVAFPATAVFSYVVVRLLPPNPSSNIVNANRCRRSAQFNGLAPHQLMSRLSDRLLLWCGAATAAGGLLHIAIIFGGPDWYQFFGAPKGLVEMARAGQPRAAISCVAIASALFVFAAYAFSGAGRIRRLPLLRPILFLIGGGLLLRGIVFVPIAVWYPGSLARICDCNGADSFAVITSAICLVVGFGYAIGAFGVSGRRGGTA